MFSRSLLLRISTVSLLLSASAAVAASDKPSPFDGFVSVSGGADTLVDSYSYGSYVLPGMSVEGEASGEYNLTSMLGLQGDLAVRWRNQTEDSFSSTDRQIDGAAHVFYREPGQFLFGAFAQIGNDDISGNTDFSAYNFNRYYGGIEGQVFLGDATLYGQIAAQKQTYENSSSASGFVATLEARYFLTPNFKVEAHVGVDRLKDDQDPFGQTQWKAGLGGEYRFDQSPFSVFGEYDFGPTGYDGDGYEVVSDNRFYVGVKFNFGAETLEDRDRSGASLKPVSSDPLFIVPVY